MRTAARFLALALLLAIKPACGGGGGGGGLPAGPVAAPLLPAGNAPGATFPPVGLATLPGVVDTIAVDAMTDAAVQSAIQASFNKPHSVLLSTGGARAPIKFTAQVRVPAFQSVGIDGSNVTLDGNAVTRLFLKEYQSNFTVQRIHFVNGNPPILPPVLPSPPGFAGDEGSGGAINVEDWDGSLTVIQCTFTNCSAVQTGPDRGGGAIRAAGQKHFLVSGCTFLNCSGSNGGALNSLGCQFSVLTCTFTGCSATGTGGGQDAGPSGQGGIGGAIYIDGVSQNATIPRLVVSSSTFTNNTSNDYGGAIFGYTEPDQVSNCYIDATTFDGNTVTGANRFGGAVYSQNGTWTVANTTFSANSATSLGGAFWNHTDQGVAITNCTFTANHTGLYGGAMALTCGILDITNCTIANNTSSQWAAGISGGGGGTIRNSIVSNNTGSAVGHAWNADTTLNDGGGNFQFPGPSGGQNNPVAAGATFADPKLGPLGSNGGLTQTMLLGGASPCINGGVSAGAPLLDQRGNPRTGLPDAGAVEAP